MKESENILPPLNQRILDIVNHIAGGNVAKFARSLEGISQQRIDRIFKLDTRTKKIPSVHNDIVEAIIKKYPEFNSTWLLTGVGTMLNDINGKIPKGNIVYFPHVQKNDFEKYIANYDNQEYINNLEPFPVKEFPITYESGKMAFDVIDNAMKVGDARFKVSTGDVVIARNISKDYSRLSDKEIYVIITKKSIFIRLCKELPQDQILLSPGDKALFDEVVIAKKDILVLYHAYACFIS